MLARRYGGGGGAPIPSTFTVTYDQSIGNSGSGVPTDSNAYNSGDTVTVLGNTGNLSYTSGGYLYYFRGWAMTNPTAPLVGNETYIFYEPGWTFTITSNVTLYAVYSKLIIYNSNKAMVPSVITTGTSVPIDNVNHNIGDLMWIENAGAWATNNNVPVLQTSEGGYCIGWTRVPDPHIYEYGDMDMAVDNRIIKPNFGFYYNPPVNNGVYYSVYGKAYAIMTAFSPDDIGPYTRSGVYNSSTAIITGGKKYPSLDAGIITGVLTLPNFDIFPTPGGANAPLDLCYKQIKLGDTINLPQLPDGTYVLSDIGTLTVRHKGWVAYYVRMYGSYNTSYIGDISTIEKREYNECTVYRWCDFNTTFHSNNLIPPGTNYSVDGLVLNWYGTSLYGEAGLPLIHFKPIFEVDDSALGVPYP